MKRHLILALALLLMVTAIAPCMTACDVSVTFDDVFVTVNMNETNPETPTQEETTMEETTIPVTEETTAEETAEETTEPEFVRDGTPKKYITIRMDDGTTQDERMMEIMRKYGVDCCTFYLNSGLFGANWTWVGQNFNRPDVTHIRYTRRELATGIYDGFDVQCHTVNHPSLKNYTEKQVTAEVKNDATTLGKIFGYEPVGLAWPGGDTEWNEQNIVTILNTTNIRYGSCTTRNTMMGIKKFGLPEYFMTWYPSCSVVDADAMALLEEFLAAECTEDMLFYVWGHGFELDLHYSWDKFELMIKTIAEAAAEDDSIVLVTNSEFYELFKDEIPAWKE